MKDLIKFLKDKIGYRKVAHPSPKEVGLPVIYNDRKCILLPFINEPTLHQHLSNNCYDINGNKVKDGIYMDKTDLIDALRNRASSE